MKIIKAITALTILLLLIGIVSAVDLNDFKLIDGFTSESEYWASNEDFGLSVNDYNNDTDYDLLFTNDTDYIVVTDGNISNYTDTISDQVGCEEVVTVNNEQVLVEVYDNNGDIDKCYEYLMEFNKINNLEPVSV